jgi:NAD(P)-dependent dehydrogenase (short-subunit alcohol dehydrogenase family)
MPSVLSVRSHELNAPADPSPNIFMASVNDSKPLLLQYGYRMSKAAANMVVKNLSIDLKQKGVAVVAFHPGAVRVRLACLSKCASIKDL